MKSAALLVRAWAVALAAFLAIYCSPSPVSAEFGWTQDEMYPQVLPADYLTNLAKERIEKQLAAEGETRRTVLALSRKMQSMRCPAGELVCETELPKGLRYGGLNPVTIKVYVNGALFRRAICYYELHVYGTMLIAAHDLRLEKVLTPADVRVEEHEVESSAARYLSDPSAVAGRVPTRILRGGTPITEDLLQNPVVIDVGSPVLIVSNHGGIQVNVDGIALQKGRVGKIIRVRNAKSSKIMRARVIDAATVELL